MNLYELHKEPHKLKHYGVADQHIPKLFFDDIVSKHMGATTLRDSHFTEDQLKVIKRDSVTFVKYLEAKSCT